MTLGRCLFKELSGDPLIGMNLCIMILPPDKFDPFFEFVCLFKVGIDNTLTLYNPRCFSRSYASADEGICSIRLSSSKIRHLPLDVCIEPFTVTAIAFLS
jgi:hypothetical protein